MTKGWALALLLLLPACIIPKPKLDCRVLGCPAGQVCKMDDYQIEAKWVCVPEPPPPDPTCPPGPPSEAPTCPDGMIPDSPAWACGPGTAWEWVPVCKVAPPPPDPCSTLTCECGCAEGKCKICPPPPGDPCPPLSPTAVVYLKAKPYGHGEDSTVRVRGDAKFCEAIHGPGAGNDCHLEGWPTRTQCERKLIGGCPIWEWRNEFHPNWLPCYETDPYTQGGMSCDHFGSPASGQDDPQTPEFEGVPAECGLQRDAEGKPRAGFFMVGHGLGQVRACMPAYPNTCSNTVEVNH